jgi:hypothetical protein
MPEVDGYLYRKLQTLHQKQHIIQTVSIIQIDQKIIAPLNIIKNFIIIDNQILSFLSIDFSKTLNKIENKITANKHEKNTDMFTLICFSLSLMCITK